MSKNNNNDDILYYNYSHNAMKDNELPRRTVPYNRNQLWHRSKEQANLTSEDWHRPHAGIMLYKRQISHNAVIQY